MPLPAPVTSATDPASENLSIPCPQLPPNGGLLIDDRKRVDLDEIAGRKGEDPHDNVGRLVLTEQRCSSFFNDRQVSIALVANNIDRNPGHVFGRGTRGRKGSTKIAEHLAGLKRQIAGAHQLPIDVFRFLAGDENELGPPCYNHL